MAIEEEGGRAAGAARRMEWVLRATSSSRGRIVLARRPAVEDADAGEERERASTRPGGIDGGRRRS